MRTTAKRSGPFWDGVEGRAPIPRAAAMLYDTVGPALLVTLNPDQFQSTLDFNVKFLRPVRPGRIVGKGRVVHRNADIAYIEAALHDSNDATIAVATATAKVIPLAVAKDAV